MNELHEVELEEISLVDEGANQHAKVSIFKRGENNMTDGVEKMSDDMKKKMKEYYKMSDEDMEKMSDEDMTKKMKEMEKAMNSEKDKMKKALEDNGFVLKGEGEALEITKSAPEETVKIDGETFAKSAVPEPILKRLEALEKADEFSRLEKRARDEFHHLTGSIESHVKLVKSFGDDADVMAILRAADKALAPEMEEAGKSGADSLDDPLQKLDTLAKAYAEKNSVSFQKAYGAVLDTDEGARLYAQTR